MDKKFLLKCSNCKWVRQTNGRSEDLKDLHETTSCSSCNGRSFRCPKCGLRAKMIKMK